MSPFLFVLLLLYKISIVQGCFRTMVIYNKYKYHYSFCCISLQKVKTVFQQNYFVINVTLNK